MNTCPSHAHARKYTRTYTLAPPSHTHGHAHHAQCTTRSPATHAHGCLKVLGPGVEGGAVVLLEVAADVPGCGVGVGGVGGMGGKGAGGGRGVGAKPTRGHRVEGSRGGGRGLQLTCVCVCACLYACWPGFRNRIVRGAQAGAGGGGAGKGEEGGHGCCQPGSPGRGPSRTHRGHYC